MFIIKEYVITRIKCLSYHYTNLRFKTVRVLCTILSRCELGRLLAFNFFKPPIERTKELYKSTCSKAKFFRHIYKPNKSSDPDSVNYFQRDGHIKS